MQAPITKAVLPATMPPMTLVLRPAISGAAVVTGNGSRDDGTNEWLPDEFVGALGTTEISAIATWSQVTGGTVRLGDEAN